MVTSGRTAVANEETLLGAVNDDDLAAVLSCLEILSGRQPMFEWA